MNHSMLSDPTNTELKIFFLKSQPLFFKLSQPALHELAALFHAVYYKKGTKIVSKGEAVDSFSLIVNGQAEVVDSQHTIAVLHPGESIGLGHGGLFSNTGLRTQDVLAKEDLCVFRIETAHFQSFLLTHPEINVAHHTQIILRSNFIKQIEPFAQVDLNKMMEIAEHISIIDVPAHHTIFKEGEEAEECYFLVKGEIQISFKQTDGKQHMISDVDEPTLFGELSLLTHEKRNAQAVTKTDCTLLVLNKKDFHDLLKKGNIGEDDINQILLDKERFQKEKNVTLHTRKTIEGKEIAILKNEIHLNYLSVSPEALFVWNQLDGNHTLQDIALLFYKKYHQIAVDEIAALITQFINSGFVHSPKGKFFLAKRQLTKNEKLLLGIRKVMEAHVTFSDANVWLTRLYKKIGYLFYKPISLFLMSLITIVGFFAFINYISLASHTLYTTPHAWIFLALQSPLLILVVPLHELTHALTTKYYSRQVRTFGVGWFWVGPMAFTDTSDMWLSERIPRLMVTFSGLFFNSMLAGLFSLLACLVPDLTIATFLWLFAFSNYLAVWTNLDPLIELDGYYLLMDYFDRPNLRSHALVWLIDKKGWKKIYIPEMVYWISCIVFIAGTASLSFVVQHFILNPVLPRHFAGLDLRNLQWIVPILVIVVSGMSLYSLIKSQQRASG